MDTPTQESSTSALNIDSAANEFSKLFAAAEPEATQAVEEPEKEQEAAEPEAQAEEEAKEVQAEESDKITIEVDGKQVELTKAELADYYKNGLRQADYTRKTMEAAETRKAAEAERQKALQERREYSQNLMRLEAQTEAALAEQQQLDWDGLLQSDPVEYLKQKALYEKRYATMQQIAQQKVQIEQLNQAEQQKAFVQTLQEQQEQLLAKLPEWKDAKKASEDKAALRSYLLAEGYAQEAVDGISDAKAVLIARKAMLYDQMISKASAAAKKVSTLPTKVERPGAGRSGLDQRSSAFQKLSKSGKVEDAAAVFRSFI